jgi:hypothetical protein
VGQAAQGAVASHWPTRSDRRGEPVVDGYWIVVDEEQAVSVRQTIHAELDEAYE